jgi:hypothetical protein
MLAFRGACGEPPRLIKPAGVSPVTLIPQESRTLHSNQHVTGGKSQKSQKQQSFRKEPLLKRSVILPAQGLLQHAKNDELRNISI